MARAQSKLPLAEYPARRVLLIKPSALGDVVHSLPVLTALRHRYPAAHITWLVNSDYAPLLRGHPDLDAVLTFDRAAVRRGVWPAVRHARRLAGELRRGGFDLTIDLQGLFRSGLMTLFSRAPRRVGLASAREGARLSYTDVVDAEGLAGLHAVDRYWQVARVLGAGDAPFRFHVPVPADGLAWARETLSPFPRPWVFLGVGASRPTKRWPSEHFAWLADRAQDEFGGTAVFVGTAAERPLAAATAALLTGLVCDLTGRTTLPQLVGALSLADVMAANDTGPMHLAAALGRPVVAPYTCTSARRHGPYTPRGGAVETAVACAGSYRKKCDRLECMQELTPDRLWPPLQQVLLQWQRTTRNASSWPVPLEAAVI